MWESQRKKILSILNRYNIRLISTFGSFKRIRLVYKYISMNTSNLLTYFLQLLNFNKPNISNNTCKNLEDYTTLDKNNNCYYNRDVYDTNLVHTIHTNNQFHSLIIMFIKKALLIIIYLDKYC